MATAEQSAAGSSDLPAVERTPLQIADFELVAPEPYAPRLKNTEDDASTLPFDPELAIRPIDKKRGIYSLEWRGYDGDLKKLKYHRPDTVDVVVAATITAGETQEYRYNYELRNLASSGQYLSGFFLQTFADNVIAHPLVTGGYVGVAGQYIPQFSEGTWIGFGKSNFGESVQPGSSATVPVESNAPPGLVKCRVHGGPMKMIGIGEEPPLELEDALPGYAAWPIGFTIGPDDRLQTMNFEERATYLQPRFDAIETLGWAVPTVLNEFRSLLSNENSSAAALEDALQRWGEQISPELLALIRMVIDGQHVRQPSND